MNENIELLEFIYQNAEMGVNSLNQLLEKLNDENIKTFIREQYNEYKSIFDESEKIIKKYGEDVKSAGTIKKIESYLMINMKTMVNKSPDSIAEMLMRGNLMGIIQLVRRLKQYKNRVDKDVYSLGEKLLKFEEKNLENCKKFLR